MEVVKTGGIGAIAGGVFIKILDVLSKRRGARTEAEARVTDSALSLIETMKGEIAILKDDNEKFRQETYQCQRNYEALSKKYNELEITLRLLYDHMRKHVQGCKNLQPFPEK